MPLCRFDPLGLGGDPERLKWFAESERIHSRWAMLAVAGILVQVGLITSLQELLLLAAPTELDDVWK